MGVTDKLKAGGAGVAAAAAAGVAFLIAAKKRSSKGNLQGWALKVKGEVLDSVSRLKHINEETYGEAVDEAIAKYKKVDKASRAEWDQLSKELKASWGRISKALK